MSENLPEAAVVNPTRTRLSRASHRLLQAPPASDARRARALEALLHAPLGLRLPADFHGRLATTLSAVLVGLALAAPGTASAEKKPGKHPRLASASARCTTCHGTLTSGKKLVHAATEDCSGCHEVVLDASGTTIRLTEAQPALCVTCHGDLEKASKGEVKFAHAPVTDSCTTCHAPHASDNARLLLSPQAELCGACHETAGIAAKHGGLLTPSSTCTACHLPHGGTQAKLLNGAHQHAPFADGSCSACHRPSAGDRVRLQARGNRLCLACHDDPAAKGAKGGSVHEALREPMRGKGGCRSCHLPHMAPQPKLLEKSGSELCGTCHEAVLEAAKAKTGHAPARDDCGSCHEAHSSPNPSLLSSPVGELCSACHDLASADLVKKHLGADLAKLACLSCHSPHGAGNPALLAKFVHPPVLDGCDSCHEGSSRKLASGGGADLCEACHSDVREKASKAKVQHAAIEMGACTSCHSAHASPRPKLGRVPAASACSECHPEQIAGAGETAHGVIDLLGCEACHQPHGGENPKLLRAKGPALCLECHGEAAVRAAGKGAMTVLGRFTLGEREVARMPVLRLSVDGSRGHPVAGHPTVWTPTGPPRRAKSMAHEGPVTCLSCHDPHKGRSKGLFANGVSGEAELCGRCHKK